jgi:hypothetical protein
MTTDQLEDHLRSEFHRLDLRMVEEGNLDLPSYFASTPARSHRLVRVAAVVSVAAAVVLLTPILNTSDKAVAAVRLADAQVVLPGETPFAAQIRINDACMAEGGIPAGEKIFVSENSGPLIQSVAYKDSPEMRARQDICSERFLALGIFRGPTVEQLTAFYPHVVALVECLSAKGFDMGTITSRDEYISSGAKTPVSPKLVELEEADNDPRYWKCLRKELIPYTSILRT